MNRKYFFCLLFITYFLFSIPSVRAEYVLPYPSFMPGNKLYRVMRIIDTLKRYWYFGNIAQIKYHLGLSDKYLVEAKTLMEYNQYLLASDALRRSDDEFNLLPKYIEGLQLQVKDVSVYIQLVDSAGEKHKEVLLRLAKSVPEEFIWTPEKSASTRLQLRNRIQNSSSLRDKVVAEIRSL